MNFPIWRKLLWLTKRRNREAELLEELQFHLQEESEERRAAGLPREQAESAARRDLGNTTLLKEDVRAMWGWSSLERLWQDLRYAVRTLRKTPGFAAVAILSIALGVGANTAIFSLLNAVVLRQLPVPRAGELVQLNYTLPLWETGGANSNSYFGYPAFERFQTQSKTLEGVFGGTTVGRVNVVFRGTSGVAQADAYSSDFFSVLGLTPQVGRFFFSEEDRGGTAVVVLSDRYWRTRFAADPSIVGAGVTINQVPFTVIGVTPAEFSGLAVGVGPDAWVPLHALDRLRPDGKRWTESFSTWMLIVGRLRRGVAREQAQAELDVIHRRLLEQQLAGSELRGRENVQRFVRESHLVLRAAASGVRSSLRDRYALPLQLLMGVAGMVLLVACANVASLLLARASKRRREIAVRLALGASRGRIARQLLTESLVLAAAGGALGTALAWWGGVGLVRMISTGDSLIPLNVDPDWRVLGFTAVVTMITGILFGLAPGLRGTRVDPGPAMKEGARQAGGASHTLDRLLVVAQVALSVALITGAGLFGRTLQKLWSVNLGFDRDNVLMFSVDAKLAGYEGARAGAAYREVLQKIQTLPEVVSASASAVRPVDDYFHLVDRIDEIDGRRLPENAVINTAWNATSPGYFSTVTTPILSGRDFDLRDNETAPRVVIVNESLARKAFGGDNPIGHKIAGATVVGVVKDARYNSVRDEPRPVLYHPLFQHGPNQEFRWGFVSYELRYRTDSGLLDAVRREVASVDRGLPVFRANTLRVQTEQALLKERLLATLSSFFGVVALLLACVGLYGLMAHAVARRTSEIGVRLALGARPGDIWWMTLREALGLTLAGVAAGIPLALWVARYATALLFGVSPADPVTIASTVVALTAAAAFAGFVPARRAMRVDPMVALRCD